MSNDFETHPVGTGDELERLRAERDAAEVYARRQCERAQENAKWSQRWKDRYKSLIGQGTKEHADKMSAALSQMTERAERAEAERDALSALAELHARDRDKAMAERDALRADAERYRWLRNNGDLEVDGVQLQVTRYEKFDRTGLLYDALDAAIDAAMRGKEQSNGN